MTIEGNMARYLASAHAMQSAIAYILEHPNNAGRPLQAPIGSAKDLCVGVHTGKADAGGLARLLIAKGIFTEDEYLAAMADAMEAEAESWRDKAREIAGHPNLHFG